MAISKKFVAAFVALTMMFCAFAPVTMAKSAVPKVKIISAKYSQKQKTTTVKYEITNANLKKKKKGYYAYVDVTNPASIYGSYIENKKKGTYTIKYKGKLKNHKDPKKDMVLIYVFNKNGKYQNGSNARIQFVK